MVKRRIIKRHKDQVTYLALHKQKDIVILRLYEFTEVNSMSDVAPIDFGNIACSKKKKSKSCLYKLIPRKYYSRLNKSARCRWHRLVRTEEMTSLSAEN